MDALPDKIKEKIEDFIAALRADKVNIKKVILFGSYAKGNVIRDSDIDICIVSDDFGKDRISEMQYLFKKAARIDPRIEAIPFSSDRFLGDDNSPIIFHIKKEGIILIDELL